MRIAETEIARCVDGKRTDAKMTSKRNASRLRIHVAIACLSPPTQVQECSEHPNSGLAQLRARVFQTRWL